MSKYQFQINEYAPLNRAIDNEVEKQTSLNRLSNAQAKSKIIIATAIALVGVAFTILLGVLIYKVWLFQFASWNDRTQAQPASQTQQLEYESSKLKNSLGTLNDKSDPMITTRFTIFRTTVIETGDTVVTGLTYEPSNMETPIEQYCYLESSGLGGEPLASVENNNTIVQSTENPYFLPLINEYCLFELEAEPLT